MIDLSVGLGFSKDIHGRLRIEGGYARQWGVTTDFYVEVSHMIWAILQWIGEGRRSGDRSIFVLVTDNGREVMNMWKIGLWTLKWHSQKKKNGTNVEF